MQQEWEVIAHTTLPKYYTTLMYCKPFKVQPRVLLLELKFIKLIVFTQRLDFEKPNVKCSIQADHIRLA